MSISFKSNKVKLQDEVGLFSTCFRLECLELVRLKDIVLNQGLFG